MSLLNDRPAETDALNLSYSPFVVPTAWAACPPARVKRRLIRWF